MNNSDQRLATLSSDEIRQVSGAGPAFKAEPVKWLNSKHLGAPLWAIQAALAVGLEGEPV